MTSSQTRRDLEHGQEAEDKCRFDGGTPPEATEEGANPAVEAVQEPCSGSSLLHRTEDDEEDDINLWIANYEKKKFHPLQLFPPATWFPMYVRHMMGASSQTDLASMGALPFSFRGDLIAGITVGFMLVPQCLAFALLAGLPVQIGLYASFAPLVVYTLLGTIRQVQPGPTALMSLLTAQALDSAGLETDQQRIMGAALLALFVGSISILLGTLRFGFVVDFMSHSVMAAFCSAAGVTIATSQLKHLLGISMPRHHYWWQTASHLITHIRETDPATVAMGGTLLVVLLTLKQWKSAGSAEKRRKHCLWRWLPTAKESMSFRSLKFVADLSSLAAVFIGWLWALAYRMAGHHSVKLVGDVDGSGFKFVVPGQGLEHLELSSFLVSGSVMAVVGFLETMAVGGKFAMQARYDYEPNQELLALGLANLSSALMSGYPGTGSFSRTAVNAMLGATSLVACAISASIVFGAVFFLLPAISLLPLASLAPIIIQGAIGVVNIHDFAVAWTASRAEFVVMAATFIMSLTLTVKEGLLVGFVLSVLKTMNDLANPNLAVCGRLSDGSFRDIRNFPNATLLPSAVVVRMDARLSFANSRKMKEFCVRAVQVREAKGDHIQYVLVDGKSINHVDLTGCEMIEALAESLHSQGKQLILANLKGPVSKYLYSAGVPRSVTQHGGHLCIDMDQAIGIVNGADPTNAQKMLQELVKRVDTAKLIMQSNTGNPMYACGGARSLHIVDEKKTHHNNDAKSEGSTAPGTPTREFSREISPWSNQCSNQEPSSPTASTSGQSDAPSSLQVSRVPKKQRTNPSTVASLADHVAVAAAAVAATAPDSNPDSHVIDIDMIQVDEITKPSADSQALTPGATRLGAAAAKNVQPEHKSQVPTCQVGCLQAFPFSGSFKSDT